MNNVDYLKMSDELERRYSRKDLISFSNYVDDVTFDTDFHINYYRILDLFAHGKIKKLIVSAPPQHGKSQGSTRELPSFMLGLNPNAKVGICSYSGTLAEGFNSDVQKIIDSDKYYSVFPKTTLANSKFVEGRQLNEKRNTSEFSIVGKKGGVIAVGRGGSLTGRPLDVAILDDLFKDDEEANSPLIREKAWLWYTKVVRTRLHNESQQLIVFTRWNEDDIIGRIEISEEKVIEVEKWSDLENVPNDTWIKVNFQALKDGKKTEIDPREDGEPLWAVRHSKQKLEDDRALDKKGFECLYQGNPISAEGLLYGFDWQTYKTIPLNAIGVFNYTDTADKGEDFMYSINYKIYGNKVYITDVYCSQAQMEVTEKEMREFLTYGKVRLAVVESNNGGRGYQRNLKALCPGIGVKEFYQSKNKESRIISNSSVVKRCVLMPEDWETRWKTFYKHITTFKTKFSANKDDGAADVLTAIIEQEELKNNKVFW